MLTIVITIVCVLGIALSLKSVAVLQGAAPWTSAGWLLTVAYLAVVIAKTSVVPNLPALAEYAILAALAGAFVVAGVRDERQAEPWYWPAARGHTRAEARRAAQSKPV